MSLSGICQIELEKLGAKGMRKEYFKVNKSSLSSVVDSKTKGISCLKRADDRLLATFVNQMVASAFELPSDRLLRCDRGNARATRARQISIYLMHTALSFSLATISRVYNKDRTTIGYACRVIEDLRDNPAFDDRIIELENTITTVLRLATHISEMGGCNDK